MLPYKHIKQHEEYGRKIGLTVAKLYLTVTQIKFFLRERTVGKWCMGTYNVPILVSIG